MVVSAMGVAIRSAALLAVVVLTACRSADRPDGGAPADALVKSSTTSTTAAQLEGRAMSPLEKELLRHTFERYTGDLAEIKRRKVLRVLTRNNSSNYFITRGEERGFQYELAKSFADELGVRLAVIVPSSRAELEAALLSGEGDLIAAGTTITATRAARVSFTGPVTTSPRVLVVSSTSTKKLETPADLANVRIHLSFRSTTYEALKALEPSLGRPLELVDVPEDCEMEEMIARVAKGEYEATIADQDVAEMSIAGGADVMMKLPLEGNADKAWVLRPDAPELTRVASDFVKRHARDGLIKIYYDRYFRSRRAAKTTVDFEFRADQNGKLSPFDDIFRREGKRVGIDWRLLAAIAFTESRFDPVAKSAWGAVGLMQVLPSSALAVGVAHPEDPAQNIKAGASYFKWLVDRFDEPGLEPRQRIRFALASYNAGLGHIADARVLAEKTHRNPDVWFGNVENALRLKVDRKWHELTRFGYCRAEESIRYVSLVQSSYDVFARHAALEPGE